MNLKGLVVGEKAVGKTWAMDVAAWQLNGMQVTLKYFTSCDFFYVQLVILDN